MSDLMTINTDDPTTEDLVNIVLANFDGRRVDLVRQGETLAGVVPSHQEVVRTAERLQARTEAEAV